MNMKRIIRLFATILFIFGSVAMTSCGRYREFPFGGMNGRVQKVTVFHLMPEVWYAGNVGTDVMYMNSSVYDVDGNEIASALMDSAGRIQTQAESLFENGICVRSIQRAGGKTTGHLSLVSGGRGNLEYTKEQNGKIVRMSVRESTFGRRHKSVISEDGQVVSVSVVRTDRYGYPVEITTTDMLTGEKSIETNILDKKHNVTEKHVVTVKDGKEEERVTYIEYGGFDEHGNWLDARTYNDFRLPEEVVVREFEYWE